MNADDKNDEGLIMDEVRSMIELFGTFPSSKLERIEGFIYMDSGSNSAYESYALALPDELDGVPLEETAIRVKRVLDFFHADEPGAATPHIWTLFPGVPDVVEEILESRGITRVDDFVGMLAETAAASDVKSANDAHGRAGYVEEATDADEWAEATWRGFDSDDDASDGFLRFSRYALSRQELTLFVAREPGLKSATSTGMLCTAGDIAGIYYVATPPKFRRRGFAWLMMEALMMRAQELGFDKVCLLATQAGLPLYEKCGFRAIYQVKIRQCGE